jgi:hypothetical protein
VSDDLTKARVPARFPEENLALSGERVGKSGQKRSKRRAIAALQSTRLAQAVQKLDLIWS